MINLAWGRQEAPQATRRVEGRRNWRLGCKPLPLPPGGRAPPAIALILLRLLEVECGLEPEKTVNVDRGNGEGPGKQQVDGWVGW